ncbi:hypothetical protein ACFQ48_20405 [Hymenobacter caeli]|uniref:Glycosyl hydrolases family 2 sugar binding domain-containing protein n=1 Tax=Hymenobacter caeli TaxID=2735894 RepID=A0ABX2FVU1_9BACT|nr:hypothetical protein [Hymenobacter caeli]NRT21328.1 hypothetical protein [Hymenobacter caeli]
MGRLYLFLLALLWLPGPPARAQQPRPDTAAVLVNRLPAKGLPLTKGWRYHAGDDPAWARPGFDDSRWDTLNPARPRPELPPRLGMGISWLRLRFRLGDSLRQRALRLQAVGYGAWEIYLNGRLVQHAGTVRASPTQVPDPDHLPAIVVPAGGPAEQVLAIRFAPWQSPWLRLNRARGLLSVSLLSATQVQKQEAERVRSAITFSMMAGVFRKC